MKLLILTFITLVILTGCGHKQVKQATNLPSVKEEIPKKLTSLNFPYLDSAENAEFLEHYFNHKIHHNLLMTKENMSQIKSVYFKDLLRFEETYEAHRKRFCQEKKITDATKNRFKKLIPKDASTIQKENIREAVIAVYLKNDKDCKHINQDLYQHSMLENLTLEIKLIDDILAYYNHYTGEKTSSLKNGIAEIEKLKALCEHYFTLILPNDLDEYFFNTYIGDLDPGSLKFLKNEFKGKPFDSMALLTILKEI